MEIASPICNAATRRRSTSTKRPRELRIRSQQRDDGHVLVAVADSGSGIEADNMNELYKALFTTKPSGMGMGLSICRSIIEAHGGRVSAANKCRAGRDLSVHFADKPVGAMAYSAAAGSCAIVGDRQEARFSACLQPRTGRPF